MQKKIEWLQETNASKAEIRDLFNRKIISGKVAAEALRNSRR